MNFCIPGTPTVNETWFTFHVGVADGPEFFWFSYGKNKELAKERWKNGRPMTMVFDSWESTPQEIHEIQGKTAKQAE